MGKDEDALALWSPGFPSMLYGRWLKDFENAPPAVWRRCFKSRVLEQMNALDDEDPTNDTTGLKTLAPTLFQAGDRQNAGAIMAIVFKTLEDRL